MSYLVHFLAQKNKRIEFEGKKINEMKGLVKVWVFYVKRPQAISRVNFITTLYQKASATEILTFYIKVFQLPYSREH